MKTELRSVGIEGCVGQYQTDTAEEAAREGATEIFEADSDLRFTLVQVNDSAGSHYYFARAPAEGGCLEEVVWRWTVPPDLHSEADRLYADICDEYAILRVETPTSTMLVGRYGGRWVCNPSARPVLAGLLRRQS